MRRWARNPSDFSKGKIDVSHQSQLSERAQPRNASRSNRIHRKVRTKQQKARSPFELSHRGSKSRKQRSPGVEKRGGKNGKKWVRVETTKLLRSNLEDFAEQKLSIFLVIFYFLKKTVNRFSKFAATQYRGCRALDTSGG